MGARPAHDSDVVAVDAVISPELALVDPELAAWANRRSLRLATQRELVGPVVAPAAVAPDADALAQPAGAIERSTAHDPGREAQPLLLPATEKSPLRWARAGPATTRVLVLAVVAAGLGFAAGRALSPDVLDSRLVLPDVPAALESPRAPRPAPSASGSEPGIGEAATGGATKLGQQERTTDGTRPAKATGSPSNAGTATAPAPEPQEFAWLAVTDASHYRVEFYRGERQILVAFPVEPRLTVEGSWRHQGTAFSLEPGTYRWVVRPGFGPRDRARYGAPTVTSTWLVER